MLTKEEKGFFATTVWGASKLSRCAQKDGALLVRDRKILSYGYNKIIIQSKDWEMSAIHDALFGVRDLDMTGSALFSTRFPKIEELKLMVATGVESLYFFGKINDPKTVLFANDLSEASIPLEIIELKK